MLTTENKIIKKQILDRGGSSIIYLATM